MLAGSVWVYAGWLFQPRSVRLYGSGNMEVGPGDTTRVHYSGGQVTANAR